MAFDFKKRMRPNMAARFTERFAARAITAEIRAYLLTSPAAIVAVFRHSFRKLLRTAKEFRRSNVIDDETVGCAGCCQLYPGDVPAAGRRERAKRSGFFTRLRYLLKLTRTERLAGP